MYSSMENGESAAENIVRGSRVLRLISHVGQNLRSMSGNESSFAGELSIYAGNNSGKARELSIYAGNDSGEAMELSKR